MSSMPIVLMYHSIAEVPQGTDPFHLHVSPKNFRSQIEALAAVPTVSLAELADWMASGRAAEGTIALTFDDAYENNLSVAAPILQEAGVPATLFVCPGLLGREHFWWDRLIDTVIEATRIPPTLDDVPADLTDANALLLRLSSRDHLEARIKLALSLWRSLQGSDLADIDRALASLAERFAPQRVHDRLRPMREEEVTTAAAVFDIGGHSLTHPAMTTLDADGLHRELAECRTQCERLAGKRVSGFAYPFGDLNATVAEQAAQHFRFACSTREAAIGPRTSLWAIPRIHVHDWSGEKLLERIRYVARMARLLPPLRLAVHAIRHPRSAAIRIAEAAGIRAASRR
jgi:peptidoglycan/xylan/chitin deacetylase (PgdA/CDA1 family)